METLKEAKYNGCYFDRTGHEDHRLCTQEGWFTCQVWQEGLQEWPVGGGVYEASIQKEYLELHLSPLPPLQGAFDRDACSSLHSINPYSSQESRIIFSTWNLDHR